MKRKSDLESMLVNVNMTSETAQQTKVLAA